MAPENVPQNSKVSEEEVHLDRALEQLPARLRDALLLRYVEDRSIGEIAVLTDVPVETAKKRLHRALIKLRASFAAQGIPCTDNPPPPVRHLAKSNSLVAPTLAATVATSALSKAPAASTILLTKSISSTLALHALAKTALAVLVLLLIAFLGTALASHTSAIPPSSATAAPVPAQTAQTKPFVSHPNEPAPPAIAELEKQIFVSRDAITSGRFVGESVGEDLSTGKTARVRAENNFDQAHSVYHRYFNGEVDIRCFTPDFVYDYRGAYLMGAPTGVSFLVYARGQEPGGLRPYDPRALMLIPMDYSNACLQKRDLFIGSMDRYSFHVDETQWENQKALRVSFQKPSRIAGDGKVSYLAVPSRGFNVVEITASYGQQQIAVKCTLQEILPGIWFPDHVNYSRREGEALYDREDLTMRVLGVNQPLDPGLFTLKGLNIPVGVRVVQIGGRGGKWDGENIIHKTIQDHERWLQQEQELRRVMEERQLLKSQTLPTTAPGKG